MVEFPLLRNPRKELQTGNTIRGRKTQNTKLHQWVAEKARLLVVRRAFVHPSLLSVVSKTLISIYYVIHNKSNLKNPKMKRKRSCEKRRTKDEIVKVLKILFHKEEFDGSQPLPKTFVDEWNTRLDAFANEHFEALHSSLESGRLKVKKRQTDRSNRLWRELLDEYSELSCLGTPKVTLTQEGGLETEGICYYYGSRYYLEEEFEMRCNIDFSIVGPKTEYLCIGFEAYLDADTGNDKVYFSEPMVKETFFAALPRLDMVSMGRAVVNLFRKELYVGSDFFREIEYKTTNEFRILSEK